MKLAGILDLLFYRLTQCGAITGTGCHRGHHISGLTGCCAIVYMGAAILEQGTGISHQLDYEGVRERTGVTNVQHWFNKTTPNALWFNRSDVIN